MQKIVWHILFLSFLLILKSLYFTLISCSVRGFVRFCTLALKNVCTLLYVFQFSLRYKVYSFCVFSNVLIDFLLLRKKISFYFSTFAARLQYQNITKRKSYTDMKLNMYIIFHTFAQSYRCFEQNNYVHTFSTSYTNGIGFSHHQSHSYFHRAF